MINYTELTHNMHKAIRDAGYNLVKHNGVFVTDDETAVQAIIDSFNPLPQLRAELKEQLVIDSQQHAEDMILSKYPKFEVDSWQNQLNEAKAYLLDNAAVVPTIEEIATQRSVTKLVVSNRVISKAATFATFSGKQAGRRQRLEDLIDAASTVEELNAIPKFVGV